jgi:hypothetical protein
MSVQLFKLRNVPEDEAEEIRNLLTKNNIVHYETPAGNWGISMPAIWLRDEDQLVEAKRLIELYQRERQVRGQSMQRKSILGELVDNPLQFILYTLLAAVILYFSVIPFLNFGQE